MAKTPVRVLQSFKGLAVGSTTSMSLGRAREAVAAGQVEMVGSTKAKKATKKVAKKAPAKKAAKAVGRTRTTSMRGKTQTK